MDTPEISIIVPCRNEEFSIEACIRELHELIQKQHLNAEIVAVNNDSSDATPEILQKIQGSLPELRVVTETIPGYGAACMRGLSDARGKYLIMLDGDMSYDPSSIPLFIESLKKGNELVVGNRFSSKIEKGTMPWHHQHIGNPLFSFLLRLLFKTKIGDIHCGMRAITADTLIHLKLQTTGMEFASEMIVKAAKLHIAIAEVPVTYRVRIGQSKLRSFADGWRHLRFILLFSPLVLFFIPGVIAFGLGSLSMIVLYFSTISLWGVNFVVHPMFISGALMSIGYQLIFFALFAKIYAVTHLRETSRGFEKLFRYFSIEKALIAGGLLALAGIGLYLYIFVRWLGVHFGTLDEIKNAIVALTITTLGIQTVFSGFMLSILGIQEK